MVIRRAHVGDREAVAAPWWQPDRWRVGGHSFIDEVRGSAAGAAMRCPNRVHPLRDSGWLHLTPDASPGALLQALRELGGPALSFKAAPGSPEHIALIAAGAQPYQHCPAQLVPTGTVALREWCAAREDDAAPEGVILRAGATRTLRELAASWTSLYEVVHASWSPTADRALLMKVFTPMIEEELDVERAVLALVDGELVAACFVFTGEDTRQGEDTGPGEPLEVITEALAPGHPQARAAVGAGMARVLSMAGGRPVEFDGHLSDPHFFPLLQSLPGVRAGSTPLDLLELAV